jgi:hypothetical protein
VTALYCAIDTVPPLTDADFNRGSVLRPYIGRIDSLRGALDAFRPRSGVAAGVLSAVLPGAGYFMGDRTRSALFALLFNGLLAWSTVEFVRHENYGAAAFAALIGSGFYAGSIVGSVRAVDSWNERKRHAIIRRYVDDLDVAP